MSRGAPEPRCPEHGAVRSAFAALWTRSPQMGPMDVGLASVVIALMGFGVVMVYSASAVEATVEFGDPQYFLKRQAVYAGAATLAMLVLSRLDCHLAALGAEAAEALDED